METVIGALIAFMVEVLAIALLLEPRWTLRKLSAPLRRLWRRARSLSGRRGPAWPQGGEECNHRSASAA